MRILIGICCRLLGDPEGADLEFASALQVFEQLGATPDRQEALSLIGEQPHPVAALTEREREVLRLVAAGRTNRAIADELVISDNTVRRHLQNIFFKTGATSRAAATAFAYANNLI